MSCVMCLRIDGNIEYDESSNVATIPLDGAIPDTGYFDMCFPGMGSTYNNPYCVTPCTYPQAIVNFKYGDTTYSNILCSKGCAPGYVRLSQLVKGASQWGKLHFRSAYGTTSQAIFSLDPLPAPNTCITVSSGGSSSSSSDSSATPAATDATSSDTASSDTASSNTETPAA